MDNSKPIHICRDEQDASVAASVWLRSTQAGVFYDVSVSRAYPKSEDEVGYSNTFGDRHLDALIRVILRAKSYIRGRKASP